VPKELLSRANGRSGEIGCCTPAPGQEDSQLQIIVSLSVFTASAEQGFRVASHGLMRLEPAARLIVDDGLGSTTER